MSLARSVVTFCIDISPTMGAKRKVTETVTEPGSTSNEGEQTTTRERETTDLQWVLEFVARKVQGYILSGLKTAKVHILLYGSPRTNNVLREKTTITDGYEGIDEVFRPATPSISTLELLRCLRAATEEEKPHPSDPLDALVAAITTLQDRSSEITSAYRKTIYLITDGKSRMNKDDKELIQAKLLEDNITLKVVGIDFDDAAVGYKEEDKESLKGKNESWWHKFVTDLPTAGIATAARVIESSTLPSIHLQMSAPSATSLTFGDPLEKHTDSTVMDISIKIYKATAVARPLSQKKLSKIAQESAAAQSQSARLNQQASELRPSSTPPFRLRNGDGEVDTDPGFTYGVKMHKKYFFKDDLEMTEGGIEGADPLPEGAEKNFALAYKLGATLVAVNTDLQRKMNTMAGMEILQFTRRDLYHRNYHMSETWFVFASEGNYKAQLQFSSLVQAMAKQQKYAIVRYVRTAGSEPKLGILAPVLKDEIDGVPCEWMCFVEAPFREDLKRFTFPPLDRVVNREGVELTEHASLPSMEMQGCMDDLIDSMDLMDAIKNEDGQAEPWFRCIDSFNPAIHTTKEAVAWRVFHPEDRSLPLPHPEVVKFLQPPEKIVQRAEPLGKRCREAFDLGAYYPIDKKMAKRQAEERARAAGDADVNGEVKEINLEGVMDEELAAEARQKAAPAVSTAVNDDESDTEGEEEVQLQPPTVKREGKSAGPADTLQLESGNEIDDFEKKLADRHTKVEDAIDAMANAVSAKVTSSFGSNSYSVARDMLKALRKGALEYEEADRFNSFLRSFKTRLLDETSRRSRADFWDTRIRGRMDLSLITDAESLGDATGVNERESDEFINL